MSNIIELKNITLSYDGDKILDNLSLSIENGQFVTFLGPVRMRQNNDASDHRRISDAGLG